MNRPRLLIAHRRTHLLSTSLLLVLAIPLTWGHCQAGEHRVTSPDGTICAGVSDEGGLRLRIEVDSQQVLAPSTLGLEFADGTAFGLAAKLESIVQSSKNSTWENPFGKRRDVPEHWNQIELVLRESKSSDKRFGLAVRVFDNGVAFRYLLGEEAHLGEFALAEETTQFTFPGDYRCWAGGLSKCAENQYPETTVGAIPKTDAASGGPYKSNLPLLVETPTCYLAISESDVRSWAGMFLTGTEEPAVRVTLDPRNDGRGCVVGETPCASPWRVVMIGRTAADLVDSDLIATLATPCQLDDISWIKPGLCAWDPWWTGLNPHFTEHEGLWARGDTQAHKDYIDLAAEMGWQYQLVDWFWYENMSSYSVPLNKGGEHEPSPPVDFEKSMPHIDLPEIFEYAEKKGVRLIIWLHSYDLDRYGIERACKLFADMGAAGLKIDFMNSDSQETMQWYEEVVRTAAKHQLLIDFHGACKPTGLARTYPNYITQEGVLGNEYNKLDGDLCTPLHTITLPFTRGLLGPMDFTPGGFLAVAESDFEITSPTQVMGTRARQLAMPVIYESPLTIFCDSPKNYRGQAGIEFYRNLPTVWDETVVLEAEICHHLVLARRSGNRWYLAAMNGNESFSLRMPLRFLGPGKWTVTSYSDDPRSEYDPMTVIEQKQVVTSASRLQIELPSAGGFAAVATQVPAMPECSTNDLSEIRSQETTAWAK